MTEWREEYKALTCAFPENFGQASPAELRAITIAAAAAIRNCTFDLWPTTELREIRELFEMIAGALPENLRGDLAGAIQVIAAAETAKQPDTAIVPGQAVYTTPAARYGETGKPLENGEWPILEDYRKPEFPLDVFPEWLQCLIKALYRESGAAVDYFAGVALSVASMAVFDRASVILEGGRRQPLSLYSVVVGGSGVKKSAAFSTLQAPLISWIEAQNAETARQHKRIEQRAQVLRKDLENALKGKPQGTQAARSPDAIQNDLEALEAQKRPFYPSPLTDATMESIARESQETGGAVCILSDEGQIVNAIAGKSYTAKDGAPNIDIILKGYDKGFTNISRSTYRVKGTVCIALCIGAQPAILDTLISHGDQAERGFPQRCLFFYPAPVYDDALQRTPCPPDLLTRWRDTIQDLLTAGRSGEIQMQATPEAVTLCKLYENAMTENRREDGENGGTMGGWYGKAHDKMARVAAVLALLEDPKGRTVTPQHIEAAIRLFDVYAVPMARECYGLAGNDLPKHLLPIMSAALREKEQTGAALEGAVYRRVHNLVRYKTGNPATFDLDLKELEARGYIRRANLDTGRRGRPTTYIQINPHYKKA